MVTKYTFCDVEKEVLKRLLVEIVNDLKTHYELEKTELNYQMVETEILSKLIKRHRILQNGAPGVSLYPDDVVERVECEMLNAMHSHIQNIYNSNEKIAESVELLTPTYLKLDEMNARIDWMAVITGDEIFQPLHYYIESVTDLRMYFKKGIANRRVHEKMLNTEYSDTAEVYCFLINPVDDFDETFAKMVCFTQLLEPK